MNHISNRQVDQFSFFSDSKGGINNQKNTLKNILTHQNTFFYKKKKRILISTRTLFSKQKKDIIDMRMRKIRRNKKQKTSNFEIVGYFAKEHKIFFMLISALALLVGAAEALTVVVIYPIISNILAQTIQIPSNPVLNFIDPLISIIPVKDELLRYSIFFILTALFVFITKTLYYYSSVKFTSELVKNAKRKVFNKCINADYQFFVDNKQGEILYKTSSAPTSLATLLQTIFDLLVELIMTTAVFVALITMSWKLVIVVAVGGVLYFYLIKYISTAISYKAGRAKRDSGQKERVIVSEYTSGIKQIKVFETFNYWGNMFDKVLDKYWHHHRRNYFWSKMPEIILWLVIYSAVGGGIIVIKLFYPGQFLILAPLIGTFAFGIFRVIPKISKFGNLRMNFMHQMPNVETVYETLREKGYSKIKNGTKKFSTLKKGIKLKNVTFSHKERDVLLENIDLEIPKDKTTALAGPSGSGKSTIVNLLLRLYDAEKGGVYLDDVNIKKYDIYSIREKVGFVSQDTFIFNGTVKDNIAFGNNYSEEEIIKAAKMASAHSFIEKLPEGYDTKVGDRGMRLSGGEQQRIAIARAMIRKPEILILDEATSSLDNISENMVQAAIDQVSKNCTTFVIAHRLTTIKNADIIHVLDKGTIVESGSHDELMEKKGRYYELYNLQQS